MEAVRQTLISSFNESGGETLLRVNLYLKPGCQNTVGPYIGLTSIKGNVPYLKRGAFYYFSKQQRLKDMIFPKSYKV